MQKVQKVEGVQGEGRRRKDPGQGGFILDRFRKDLTILDGSGSLCGEVPGDEIADRQGGV